jgi:hypothetical protein
MTRIAREPNLSVVDPFETLRSGRDDSERHTLPAGVERAAVMDEIVSSL